MEIESDGLEENDVLMDYDLGHQMPSFFLGKRGRVCLWTVIALCFNGPEKLFSLFIF
jgi:hypothetical protein